MKNIMSIKGEELVGSIAHIILNPTVKFEVKVLEVKIFYGRKRFLVTPVAGKGVAWVEKITPIK